MASLSLRMKGKTMEYLILNASGIVVAYTYNREEAEDYLLNGYNVESIVV